MTQTTNQLNSKERRARNEKNNPRLIFRWGAGIHPIDWVDACSVYFCNGGLAPLRSGGIHTKVGIRFLDIYSLLPVSAGKKILGESGKEVFLKKEFALLLFIGGDLSTVKKIRIFTVAALLGVGHRLEATPLQKKDDLLFFKIKSGGRELATDLDHFLDEAKKEIETYSFCR